MTRSRMWGAVAMAAALVVVGAAFAVAGDDGKSHKKVVIFRSGGSWLGVQIADVDTERGKELGMRDVHGAEVQSVTPGSPAEEAGLKEGDVITEYQGSRIEGVAQLTRLVRETPSGRTANIEVWRNGASKDVQVTMKARERDADDFPGVHVWSGEAGEDGKMTWFQAPTPPAPPEPPDIDLQGLEGLKDLRVFGVPGRRPRLGVTVDSVGKQLAEYFGVKQGGGALVTSVGKGSAAETAGIKAGDVIVKVDDESVQDAGDLHMAMRERRGKALTLTVVRDRRETTIKVPEPPEEDTPAPGARSRPAVDQPEMQRQIERAMRDARRAMRDGERARREAMATQRAAYAEAMRAVHEARRASGEQRQQYREALQQYLERLQSEIERQHEIDIEVEVTPEAIEVDDEAIQDAIQDAHDSIEDAVEEGIEQGIEDGSGLRQIETPSDDEEDVEDDVEGDEATEEQRAEIRRAVEEARRIRLEMQQESER